MKQHSIYIADNENGDALHLKENLLKYARQWPWFLLSLIACLMFASLYLRYAPIIFVTEAKIKIIDDSKEFDIATDALSLLGGGSQINLENEIAVLKSYRLLDQVVEALQLDIEYFEIGTIKSRQIYHAPFSIQKLDKNRTIYDPIVYELTIDEDRVQITTEDGVEIPVNSSSVLLNAHDYPVQLTLENFALADLQDKVNYLIVIQNKKRAILDLMDRLVIAPTSEKSDVLSIKMENENPLLSEAIIDELVNKFNADGIIDRQLVSKRTLDFIDERFVYLSKELDSIEVGKKDYKKTNSLSFIQADAGMTIENKAIVEKEIFRIEAQIELSKLLMETLNKEDTYELLPADIGVENSSINSLLYEYNQGILQRQKLITSAGVNNPAVQLLSAQLLKARLNIINTVIAYQEQLRLSLRQLQRQQISAGARFSELPDKEKTLRAIERQQGIKENLFLLLLQKREEASINFAVTAPSIKVVDYGLTDLDPIAPKNLLILGVSSFLGLLFPLAFFYIKFSLDTTIKTKSDLERLANNIPIIGEIPSLDDPRSAFKIDENTMKAEAFRILSTNANFLLSQSTDSGGKVVYVTSALKNDGKTVVAINLATAFSSLRKKVIIIGADLRNPQLHEYFDLDKNKSGLSNILYDSTVQWQDCIIKSKENQFLDICFSGPIPPNAAQLLAGDSFKSLIGAVKKEYDYVIVDTAPTIQVADTLLISTHADLTLFVTRSGKTDERLIEFSKGLSESLQLRNMTYVLNDVKNKNGSGYNYGYGYGYGREKE